VLLPVAVGWVSLASQGTKIVVDTVLQHECDDAYRGRVFSVNDTLFNVCFVAGTYAGALVLPATGRSTEVTLAVVLGYVTVAVWYAVAGSHAAAASLQPVVLGERRQGVAVTAVPGGLAVDTELDG